MGFSSDLRLKFPGRPGPTAAEPAWSRWIAAALGGEAEARTLDGSRVDVLTASHAWEVEWVKKWKEAPGQALLYGAASGRRRGVILLRRGKPTESIYFLRAAVACAAAGIELKTCYTL